MNKSTSDKTAAPLLLVTGVSGAGKNSALKVLEDLAYEAVGNLPVSLIRRLVADGIFPIPSASTSAPAISTPPGFSTNWII